MGSSRLPYDQVHRIGLLDIRLLNLDRHLGNILVAAEQRLIPIDHGYVLPSLRDVQDVSFEWLHFKQCKVPFDANTRRYALELDAGADARLLRRLGLPEESVQAHYISTRYLQHGVSAGLTLYRLAATVQRNVPGTGPKSPFEAMVDAVLGEGPLPLCVEDDEAGRGRIERAIASTIATAVAAPTTPTTATPIAFTTAIPIAAATVTSTIPIGSRTPLG
jgi:hypothetical protein